MNKKIVLMASVCLLLMTFAISAQDKTVSRNNTPNFSGNWTLAIDKSEMGERSRVESMLMNVRQTATEIKVERTAKLVEREDNDGGMGRGGGGMGRGGGGMGGGGNQNFTYDLNGKETTVPVGGGIIGGDAKLKAKFEKDGKLKLTQTRNFETQRGAINIKTTEIWELSADRTILNVVSEMETPRGNRKSKMVFVRAVLEIKGSSDSPLKTISGGVVNGKATSLPVPVYPPEAKEQGISGSVSVEILIDQNGDVIEAKAISGNDQLRDAAVEAAKRSKFKPTYLAGDAVMVKGFIVYNFR